MERHLTSINAASAPGPMSPNSPLVFFKAGNMRKEGSTVTADPRPGMFQIVVLPDDMLTHLQWIPLGTDAPEYDRIIFPGDAEFVPVQSSRDRVFVLKWREGDTRKFFWMQSQDPDADHTVVEAVNQILTEGHSAEQVPDTRAAAVETTSDPTQTEVQRELQGDASSPYAPPVGHVTVEALQSAMTQSGVTSFTPTLEDILHPDVVRSFLCSEKFKTYLPELLEYLPCDEQTPESLIDILWSPSFRNQAHAVTSALASGAGADLLASFGIPQDSVASLSGPAGVQAFLRSLMNMRKDPKKSDK